MKKAIFFWLLLYTFSQAKSINFRQQKISSQGVDTLSIITLNDKIFKSSSYKILHISISDSNHEMIQILRHKSIFATLKLPLADIDVKNFSVNKIEQTKSGFQIGVDWGGGDFFYERIFYFTFSKGNFYLERIVMKTLTQHSQKQKIFTKKITPRVPINKFNMSHYIINK